MQASFNEHLTNKEINVNTANLSILELNMFPIFQFEYCAKNELFSSKSKSKFICTKGFKIPVTVFLKI